MESNADRGSRLDEPKGWPCRGAAGGGVESNADRGSRLDEPKGWPCRGAAGGDVTPHTCQEDTSHRIQLLCYSQSP